METAIKVDVQYDELCAECQYPIDNQGLCIIDAEHTGRWVPPAPQETPAQQELLACPFCGSEAAFTHQGLSLDPAFDGDVYGRVYCTEGRFRCCPELQYEPNPEDEQNAFKEWNTRYRDPAFQKLMLVAQLVTLAPLQHGIAIPSELMNLANEALHLADGETQ